MINVDNKVKNIYYMLCYSFYGEQLNEKDESNLGDEAFENIYNLFSLLLCLILQKEIKKGLHREYINTSDEISTVRGKIDLNETINKNSLVKKKVICNFDEYSENCLLNRIIKTTIFYLLKSNKIGNETKERLKKLSNYFSKVDIIDIKSIKWDQVKYNRNNMSYKFVVDLCKLILKGLVVSDKAGKNKFKEFLDDVRLSTIYENFIKAYYRKHYPELNAMSKKLYLNQKNTLELIPMMVTDITLEYGGKTLIIDAKFYSKILRDSRYGDSKIISPANIHQIITYVDNQDPYKTGSVYGMLLYAQTVNEPSIDKTYDNLNMHKIMIKTLDMNEEWISISERLNKIAHYLKNDSFHQE